MALVNLTPHVININGVEIPPSGGCARVSSTMTKVAEIEVDGVSIDLVETSFGEPVGLPEPVFGNWLIVSALVRLAAPERKDLLSPGEQTRDQSGKVNGCKNLTR